MNMTQWWAAATPDQRQALADACGTKPVYLYQLSIGFRRASPILAKRIDRATGGLVSKEVLRPDIFDELAA